MSRLSAADSEGVALALKKLAKCDGVETVDLRALCSALGVRLRPDVPRACSGMLTGDPLAVWFDERCHPLEQAFNLGHELGHLAGEVSNAAGLDEIVYDEIGAALQIDGALMRRMVMQYGWHADRLLACFPSVLASTVLCWAARAAGGVAVLHSRRGRIVAAGDHIEARGVPSWERWLVREVKSSGRPHFHAIGAGAWPYLDTPGNGGVVVLAPGQLVLPFDDRLTT